MTQSHKLGKLKNGNEPAPISRTWEAPRCQAKSKRSGRPCRNPAVRGKRVCRMHGGKSTGPLTLQGIQRIKEATTTHGLYAGPDGVMGENAGPHWPGHKKINPQEMKEAFKALGYGRYRRGYNMTKPPPVLPRNADGRFLKAYTNIETAAFSPIRRD